jgi:hypothetical protein
MVQEMKKAKSRHLVAAVPSKLVDLFEVIQHVLVNPALELEHGYEAEYYASSSPDRKEHFIGSIFSIQGDHKGQTEVSGLLSASALYASRYSTCSRSEFWKTPLDWANEGKQMPMRNPEQSRELIEDQMRILSQTVHQSLPRGAKTAAKSILKQNGFAEVVNQECLPNSRSLSHSLNSCSSLHFGTSPGSAQTFFLRHGICYTHLFALGMIKRTIMNLGQLMGAEKVNGMIVNTLLIFASS